MDRGAWQATFHEVAKESDTTEQIHAQVTQWVKNTPAMQGMPESWVQSLGQEDTLEEGMATHSSILAWRTPGTEEPGGLQSIGLQRS